MKNSFLKGAVMLVVANFIVKFIGVVYKIPLGNLIGGEGMGYFGAAFEIYQLLLAFSTAGLPVAVSKMVSESVALERYQEVNKIFRVSLITFLGVGLFGFVLMFLGAGFFADIIEMPMSELSIKILSPSVFFFSIVAIFRGYFQGLQNMKPTAITQVAEALCKLFIGIGVTLIALNLGASAEILSATAILGTTLSTVIATILLVFAYKSRENRKNVEKFRKLGGKCRSSKKIMRDLIAIVIPVTVGSLVVNLTGFLDLFLIMNRLKVAGVDDVMAQFMYGSYKGYAYTLFNLPPSIIVSVNVTLIPVISAAFVTKDRKKLQQIINKSIKIISIFALPCAVGLMAIPSEILTLLYPSKPDEVLIATPLLMGLGLATLWTTLASLTTAMLQATGNVNLPIKAILIGGAIKILANYILIGIPEIGINGAVFATNICYFTIMVINILNIKKYTHTKIKFVNVFLRPIISSVLMGIVTLLTNFILGKITIIPSSIATILTICVSGMVYGVLIIVTGAISQSDLKLIPGGSKLIRKK